MLELAYRQSLRHYAARLTGRLPGFSSGSRRHPILQIAVTAATARRFGLAVGSRMRIAPDTALVVTGIITPRAPQSAFWTIDQTAAAPDLSSLRQGRPLWQGGAFIGPAEIAPLTARTDLAALQLSWGFPRNLSQVTAAQAAALHSSLGTGLASQGQLSTDPLVQAALSCGPLPTWARSARS